MPNPKKQYQEIKNPHHGGLKISELKKQGLTKKNVIDFSASLNRYGPPEFIIKKLNRINKTDIEHYPDPESKNLRRKLSEDLKINPSNVIITSGISELIDLIGQVFIKENSPVLIPEYTYGEYEPTAKKNKAKITEIPMPNKELQKNKIKPKIKENSILFLCNPNNPTGSLLNKKEIQELLNIIEKTNSLLVLDEAYKDFLEKPLKLEDLVIKSSNIILMRSFTKSFGIPGIRIGYGVSSAENNKYLRRAKIPWNTSEIAEIVGRELISEQGKNFLERTTKKILKNKEELKKELQDLKIKIYPGKANFLMMKVGNATKIREKLLKKGLVVRDCSSFGLPNHIRVGVRSDEENKELIKGLKEIMD